MLKWFIRVFIWRLGQWIFPQEVTGQVSFPSQSAAGLGSRLKWKLEGVIGCWGVTRGTAHSHIYCFKDLAWTLCRLTQTLRLPQLFFCHSIYKESFSLHHDGTEMYLYVVKEKPIVLYWRVMESWSRMENNTTHNTYFVSQEGNKTQCTVPLSENNQQWNGLMKPSSCYSTSWRPRDVQLQTVCSPDIHQFYDSLWSLTHRVIILNSVQLAS